MIEAARELIAQGVTHTLVLPQYDRDPIHVLASSVIAIEPNDGTFIVECRSVITLSTGTIYTSRAEPDDLVEQLNILRNVTIIMGSTAEQDQSEESCQRSLDGTPTRRRSYQS